MTNLPMLELPESLNYIGAFLTMDCNLSCSYCINDPEQAGNRRELFNGRKGLMPYQWADIFNRIPYRKDLPITLQGGEPTMYFKGRGVGMILAESDHYFDLLTNFALKPAQFYLSLLGQEKKLQRDAPYPSIRVSYHAHEMNRVWGSGIDELVRRCEAMREYGFKVSSEKASTDIGIYMVAHPDNVVPEIKGDVFFEEKEFLGMHDGFLFGHYAYAYSTNLISGGYWNEPLKCECRTTELLIDPLGDVWQCHFHLYNKWTGGDSLPIGSLLDPEFTMDAIQEFRPCSSYGKCIGCDTKIKNNRFQSLYDNGIPHTSVEIKNIQWPEELK